MDQSSNIQLTNLRDADVSPNSSADAIASDQSDQEQPPTTRHGYHLFRTVKNLLRGRNSTTRSWRDKLKSIKDLRTAYIILLVFTLLYGFFIYYILIAGVFFIQASTTNFLISIFSQIFIILADMNARAVLARLRLALAARDRGASLATFFSIGPSSDWLSTFQFAGEQKFLNSWCNIRCVRLPHPTASRARLSATPTCGTDSDSR